MGIRLVLFCRKRNREISVIQGKGSSRCTIRRQDHCAWTNYKQSDHTTRDRTGGDPAGEEGRQSFIDADECSAGAPWPDDAVTKCAERRDLRFKRTAVCSGRYETAALRFGSCRWLAECDFGFPDSRRRAKRNLPSRPPVLGILPATSTRYWPDWFFWPQYSARKFGNRPD
jgi:hypothetical protein